MKRGLIPELCNIMDITVAIPTYNGAGRLPEILANLQTQLNTEAIAWEILVVDGSQIHASYAVPPPRNFARIASFLAMTDLGPQPILYEKNSRFTST